MIKCFNRLLLVCLFLLPFVSYASDILGDGTLQDNPNIALGIPTAANNIPEILIARPQYVLSWNYEKRVANWVAWKLEKSDLGNMPGSQPFTIDADLKKYLIAHNLGAAVGPTEYAKTCFDRGHQVPSADRHAAESDDISTYLMSNVIPQTAFLNRIVWLQLENYARSLISKDSNKILYIVAGTIFQEDYGKIGPKKDIVVPSKNFKVLTVVDKTTKMVLNTISVSIPNRTSNWLSPAEDNATLCNDSKTIEAGHFSDGTKPTISWKDFQVDMDTIETESGFDLFASAID